MKIAHIGIAVRSLAQAQARYAVLLAGAPVHHETVPEQGVEIASFPVGDARIELTAPLHDQSPIAKFIAKRGEGIHHIAFEVDDVASELIRMQDAGVQLINQTPVQGAHDMQIGFMHPSSFNGVLIELCRYAATGDAATGDAPQES